MTAQDPRYIPCNPYVDIVDGPSFLWWQVFSVGYYLSLKIEGKNVNMESLIDEERGIQSRLFEVLVDKISLFFSDPIGDSADDSAVKATFKELYKSKKGCNTTSLFGKSK